MVQFNFTSFSENFLKDPKNQSTIKRPQVYLTEAYQDEFKYLSTDLEFNLRYLDAECGKSVPFINYRQSSFDLNDVDQKLIGNGFIPDRDTNPPFYTNHFSWALALLTLIGENGISSNVRDNLPSNESNSTFYEFDLLAGGTSSFITKPKVSTHDGPCSGDHYKRSYGRQYSVTYDYVNCKLVVTASTAVTITQHIQNRGIALPPVNENTGIFNNDVFSDLSSLNMNYSIDQFRQTFDDTWVYYKNNPPSFTS